LGGRRTSLLLLWRRYVCNMRYSSEMVRLMIIDRPVRTAVLQGQWSMRQENTIIPLTIQAHGRLQMSCVPHRHRERLHQNPRSTSCSAMSVVSAGACARRVSIAIIQSFLASRRSKRLAGDARRRPRKRGRSEKGRTVVLERFGLKSTGVSRGAGLAAGKRLYMWLGVALHRVLDVRVRGAQAVPM